MEPWVLNLVDWRKANQTVLERMVEQAEKHAEYLAEQHKRYRDQCFTLMRLIIPALALFFGYFAVLPGSHSLFNTTCEKVLGFLGFIPLFAVLGLLIWMAFPQMRFTIGRSPKESYNPEFLEPDNTKNNPLTEKDQIVSYLISSLEHLEKEIQFNEKANRKLAAQFRFVLCLLSLWLGVALMFATLR